MTVCDRFQLISGTSLYMLDKGIGLQVVSQYGERMRRAVVAVVDRGICDHVWDKIYTSA